MAVWTELGIIFDQYTMYQRTGMSAPVYERENNPEHPAGSYTKGKYNYIVKGEMPAIRFVLPEDAQGNDVHYEALRVRIPVSRAAEDAELAYIANDHLENMTPQAAWEAMVHTQDKESLTLLWVFMDDDLWPEIVTDAQKIAKTMEYGLYVHWPYEITTEESYSDSFGLYPNSTRVLLQYYSPRTPAQITVTSPTNLSNQIGDEDIDLAWTFSHDMSSVTQYSYQIEYGDKDGLTWTELAHTVSSATTYTIPANTLPNGWVKLRITAYTRNENNNTEIPTNTEIVDISVHYNPATSDVSCDGNPHSTVSWTGADQTAYQVRVGDWDSGAIFGSASSMTIPRIFAAGVYPVTVRTQTSNGDWSAWSDTLWVEITNSDPGLTGSLAVTMSGGAALVSWTESPGAAGYVLLRDGEPVYAGTALYYRDDAAADTVTWTLRCVSAAGYYSDADTLTWTLPLRCDMLRPMDDDTADWIAIRYSLDRRSRSYDRQLGTSFRYYAGREKPVAVSTGESTRTMRTTAAFKTRAQAEAILALAGRPVLYKDVTGGVIIGILNPAGYDAERVFSVDLSITEIDWPVDIDSGVEAIFTAAATHIRAIDPVTETRVKCTINSSGNWASPTTSSIAWMLEVPEGSTHLRIHTGRSGNIMAWLTSGTVKTSGKPDFCEGYDGRITIGSATPQPMEIPADCTFVYVAIRYTSGWTIPKMAQFEGSYV